MTDWRRVGNNTVLAIHQEQISEHGGQPGLRDEGLLESALARPVNKAAYKAAEAWDLAAAYGYGMSRNHPFMDGNKRTSFVVMELFLMLNGYRLTADDADCVVTAMALSDGSLSEEALADWLRGNVVKDQSGRLGP